MCGNIVALPLLHHPSKPTLQLHPEPHEFHMDDALKGSGADSRHKFSGLAFKNQKTFAEGSQISGLSFI